MSITPRDLQKLLDELEASRASRKRAWENLQEIRWALKDSPGMDREPRTARFMSATNSLQVSLSYIREANALSARCAAFLPYLPLVPCAPAQILSHGKGGFGAIELSLL